MKLVTFGRVASKRAAFSTMPTATRSSGRAAAPSLKRAITPPTQLQHLPPTPRSPPAKRQKTTAPTTLPASLTFDFDVAKQHLIDLDIRFERIFTAVKCRPFEELEEIDPFRTLVTSIVGQQVSWLAARAINHRFRRLFDPSLPEKPQPRDPNVNVESLDEVNMSFPTPRQVMESDIQTLKSAGLSTRKAGYVTSLAEHFDSGHLSAEFLSTASDEEVGKRLIGVRGIGQWTVDMFEIFSLRRPDVLPVGDLGVQKGLLRWVLAAHSPGSVSFTKTPTKTKSKKAIKNENVKDEEPLRSIKDEHSTPPPQITGLPPTPLTPGRTEVKVEVKDLDLPVTPRVNGSVAHVASAVATPADSAAHLIAHPGGQFDPHRACPLPEGLTVEVLKSRLAGKKVKGGAYLTPAEMDALTAPWKPYRSLGVFYLWAVTEPDS